MTTLSSPTWPPMAPGVAAQARSHRLHVLQIGVWTFLGTVTMLFGAFTSALLVRRTSADWVPVVLPSLLWVNTACLAASSVALEAGRAMAARHLWPRARVGVGLAIGLGVVFLVGQVRAWQELVAAGVYVPTNPHSAFFYVLTGVHALHLLAGLGLLTFAFTRARADDGRSTVTPAGILDLAATCWHFFGALWLYLFYVVSTW